MGRGAASSSSNQHHHYNSNCPSSSSSSSSSMSLHKKHRKNLATDLRLGLNNSGGDDMEYGNNNNNRGGGGGGSGGGATFFVKVYMEGIPIGRKLDLLAYASYEDMITTLDAMFGTNILCDQSNYNGQVQYHVLTYEDKEGDWLIVGDVPWEVFVSCVKRLKITRADSL
ncbi:Auxin-responsive protein IAA30 [Linum grandiflorum]